MPYQDYGGFGVDYFEGNSSPTPHPAGYSDYRRELLPFDYYAQKINDELVANGINPAGQKVLIIGCAYGYTVEYLVDNHGIDAYGMDISQYAVDQAATEIAYPERIFQGDVTVQSDIKAVQQATPGGKFKVIFSECVLECLTDAEAVLACANMRSEAQNRVAHRTWSIDGSDLNSSEYNAKTLSEWQLLVDSAGQDLWYHEKEFQPNGFIV